MIVKLCVAHAMLALLVLWPVQLRAQDGAVKESPVEEVKRAADEIQRIRTLIRELPEGKEDEALDLQLEKAEAAEKGILQRLRDAAAEAKRQGKKEEADRLSSLFREAVRNTDYFRSMEAGRPKPSPVEVVISEVCYWPKEGESEWVELTNLSDKPVNIGGWVLLDGQALMFEIPTNLPAVPPKGLVVVFFDGTGKAFVPFDKEGKAVIHTMARLTGNVLGNEGGHLALYSDDADDAGVRPSSATMQSYVAWGLSPGVMLSHAMAAGRWRGVADVPFDVPPRLVIGRGHRMEAGGSLGLRLPLKDGQAPDDTLCETLSPAEANPGKSNATVRRAPSLHLPEDNESFPNGEPMKLSCTGMGKGMKYQFQVCTNKECTQTYIESGAIDHAYYLLVPKGIPVHSTLYWRVRAIHTDGLTSLWSTVRGLVCERNRE